MSTWKDEDLLSVRAKLLDWCVTRQQPTLRQTLPSIVGAIAVLAGITGVYKVLVRGLHLVDIPLIVAGCVAVYFWHQRDKNVVASMELLGQVNSELLRRGHKL